MNKLRFSAVAMATAAILILVSGCGSTGLGDLGTILGSPSQSQPSDVQATVNFVDTQASRIDVSANNINGLQTNQTGQSIYYNAQTRVLYQNATYRPENLERGDQISVKGYNNNGQYVADTITVVRNVRG